MTEEFFKKRIKEQKIYIIQTRYRMDIAKSRRKEILKSAIAVKKNLEMQLRELEKANLSKNIIGVFLIFILFLIGKNK